jgi:hypothetical protein
MLLLAGCNLPFRRVTPDPRVVATLVQMTLTAAPNTQPSMMVPSPGETTSPTQTNTVVGVTETLTPTPTETPTPTVNPDDPRTYLGAPVWLNPLDNGSAFGLDGVGYRDDQNEIYVSGGSMVLTALTTSGYRGWRLCSQRPKDTYLEAKFQTQSCGGNDTYGIVLRANDYGSGQGYYIGFTCDGRYNLFKWSDSGNQFLINSTTSPQILAGSNQVNRIGVWANGTQLRLYANGKMLQEIEDSSITSAGYIGAFIAVGTTPGFTVRMDEIAYWNLP